jgi:hypothetical protein
MTRGLLIRLLWVSLLAAFLKTILFLNLANPISRAIIFNIKNSDFDWEGFIIFVVYFWLALFVWVSSFRLAVSLLKIESLLGKFVFFYCYTLMLFQIIPAIQFGLALSISDQGMNYLLNLFVFCGLVYVAYWRIIEVVPRKP